jgi:CPA2 family monovalent cation:H+ antiporter-2
LIGEAGYQSFLAASILSMMATPFLIRAAPGIGFTVQKLLSPESLFDASMTGFSPGAERSKGHVVIAGYGLNGRNLARVLRSVKVPHVVLELNPDAVREARARGESVIYGDCTRREVLQRCNLQSARVLVVAISDPIATRRTVAVAREMNSNLEMIVRTRYMSELPDLYSLGANQVIPEEFETGIEIFSRVLREYGIARSIIQREVEKIRDEGYKMLRTPSLPLLEMNEIASALGTASTESILIERDWPGAGKTLAELNLRGRTGATVVVVVRSGETEINPGPGFRLAAGDIIVLLGRPDEIETAVELLAGSLIGN